MNHHPFHPIIYVRGFAGTPGEIEDTVSDPYMGFNIGSTKARQIWTGDIKKFFFESPMIRLFHDHDYNDVYVDGVDQVMDPQATHPVGYRSIVIHRYYEQASKDLGMGELPSMEDFARGLSELILKLRDKVCANPANEITKKDFRVYLVAHSMGGLVCRAFLQNPKLGQAEARRAVDKVFTYATPHNGIDVRLIGNIPSWFTKGDANNFNRNRMAEYLGLTKTDRGKTGDVSLVKNFDPERFFNLVGTNPMDYLVMKGLSSFAAGESSDGLVRIENATTHGRKGGNDVPSPNAFVCRSHSGYFGIVNSEEGYQNLTRFFFGNVRIDGYLDIDELTLPPKVKEQYEKGKKVRASYLFEVIASIRGCQWQMHRRTTAEHSAIFKKFDELFNKTNGKRKQPFQPDYSQSPRLFSVFLDNRKRVNAARQSLGFAIDLSVLVPDYEVDGFLFLDDHFEGGNLFRDRIYIEATPPSLDEGEWTINHGFQSQTPNTAPFSTPAQSSDHGLVFQIPIEQANPPGIRAKLRFEAQPWNHPEA